MTANIVTNFDNGFYRPNRIDTWLEFKLPELEERKEVIRSYAKLFGVNLDAAIFERLAVESEGLSHDYLREIVSELKQSTPIDEVITLIQLMKTLLLKAPVEEKKTKEK
jgi:AAA+ superfamily predicted ATPase